ncbi:MAG: hypothetical protein ACJAVI_003152 [Candidatus Azotimanducaceae bacterium]|jgi:hypothetical protein
MFSSNLALFRSIRSTFPFLFALILFPISQGVSGADLSSGLEAHWKFDNNLLDETANQSHFSNFGLSFGSDRNGNADSSTLGTITSYARYNSSSIFQNVQTVAYWIKRPNPFSGVFIGAGSGNNVDRWEQYADTTTGEIRNLYLKNSKSQWSFFNFGTNDADWHHIVTVFGDGGAKFYFDGELVETKPTTEIPDAGFSNFYINSQTNDIGANGSNAHFDDLRLYSKQLSSSDIQELYALTGAEDSSTEPEDLHGDNVNTPTVIQLGSETSGYIQSGFDRDYFRFTLPLDGTITARTTGSTDTQGNLITSSVSPITNDDDSGEGENFQIVRELSAGDYFIYVSKGPGAYTLLLDFESASTPDSNESNGSNVPYFGPDISVFDSDTAILHIPALEFEGNLYWLDLGLDASGSLVPMEFGLADDQNPLNAATFDAQTGVLTVPYAGVAGGGGLGEDRYQIRLQMESSKLSLLDAGLLSYNFVNIDTGGVDGAAFVLENPATSEKLMVHGEKSGGGLLLGIDGVTYSDSSNNTMTVVLGDEGLPESVVIDEIVYAFSDYSLNSVDIAVIETDGSRQLYESVPVDGYQLATLRGLSLKNSSQLTSFSALSSSSGSQAYYDYMYLTENQFVGGSSLIIGLAGCTVGLVTAPTGLGGVLAASTCLGTIRTVYNLVNDKETSTAGKLFNLGTCIAGDVAGCGITIADALNFGFEKDRSLAEERINGALDPDSTSTFTNGSESGDFLVYELADLSNFEVDSDGVIVDKLDVVTGFAFDAVLSFLAAPAKGIAAIAPLAKLTSFPSTGIAKLAAYRGTSPTYDLTCVESESGIVTPVLLVYTANTVDSNNSKTIDLNLYSNINGNNTDLLQSAALGGLGLESRVIYAFMPKIGTLSSNGSLLQSSSSSNIQNTGVVFSSDYQVGFELENDNFMNLLQQSGSNACGSYLGDDAGDFFHNAKTRYPNTSTLASIRTSDTDIYALTLESAGDLTVDMSFDLPAAGVASPTIYIDLLDSSKTVVGSDTIIPRNWASASAVVNGNVQASISGNGLAAGQYYIRVYERFGHPYVARSYGMDITVDDEPDSDFANSRPSDTYRFERVLTSSGDGFGNTLDLPGDVSVDSSGNVYVKGWLSRNVFKIALDGSVREVLDSTGDGKGNAFTGGFCSMDSDSFGNVYVCDSGNYSVFKIDSNGAISTIIDANGDGKGNGLSGVREIAIDSIGNLYVRSYSHVFRITRDGAVTVFFESGRVIDGVEITPGSIAVAADDTVLIGDLNSEKIYRIETDGIVSQILDTPGGRRAETIEVDVFGNIYIESSRSLYKITPIGEEIRLAYSTQKLSNSTGSVQWSSGNKEIEIDRFGSVYFYNRRDFNNSDGIYKINPDGAVLSIGGSVREPNGIAIDSSGNIYISSRSGNSLWRAQPVIQP